MSTEGVQGSQATQALLADLNAPEEVSKAMASPGRVGGEADLDPESDEDVPVDAGELKDALSRPPAVNSSYLPLPWKGRLGYVSSLEPYPLAFLTTRGLSEYISSKLQPTRLLR